MIVEASSGEKMVGSLNSDECGFVNGRYVGSSRALRSLFISS